MKNTVPATVPLDKTNAANVAVLPRPNRGAPEPIRTADLRFRNSTPSGDFNRRTAIYGVLTPNSTDVQVSQTTSADIDTVPTTVPSQVVLSACDELAQLDQWVVGRPIPGHDKDGNPKIDKPPFSPHTQRKCSHSNPADWSSYTTAHTLLGPFPWLGFVFHESDPYSGIDLDGCRDATSGAIEGWAQNIIDQAASYTEVSPSGTGVKIWVRGTLPETIKHSMGAHKGIEIYSKQRWFTFTGLQLPGTPNHIADAQAVLDQLAAQYRKATPIVATVERPARALKESPGERAAGRASLDDVKARFNAQHTLASLLEGYGAVQTSAKDWSCPFCTHSHANTLYTGDSRLFSRSPNCKIPMKLGLDAFGLYVLIEHGNNVIAAAKKLNPITQRPRRQDPPLVEPEYRTQAQAADADRQRAARKAKAEALRDGVIGRAAIDDDMPWQARCLLDIHLQLAGQCGWHRKSVAHMAEMLDKSERWVQRFNEYLIDIYISRTTTSRHDTAIWTLLDAPIQRIPAPKTDNSGVIVFEAENDERSPEYIYTEILDTTQELVSGGADQPDYAELDRWEACDSENCGYDLALEAVGLETEPVTPESTPRVLRYGPLFCIADGVRCGASASSEAEAWVAWGVCKMHTQAPAESLEPEGVVKITTLNPAEIPHRAEFDDSDEPEAGIYNPDDAWTSKDDPRAKAWRNPCEPRMREIPLDQAQPEAQMSIPRAPRVMSLPATDGVPKGYRAKVEQLSPVELLGELEKQSSILSSPRSATYRDAIRAKLDLIEQVIARSEKTGVWAAPRSQAPAFKPQARFFQEISSA